MHKGSGDKDKKDKEAKNAKLPSDPREAFLTPFPKLSPEELDEWTKEAAKLAKQPADDRG